MLLSFPQEIRMKSFRIASALACVLIATSAFAQGGSYRAPAARTHAAANGALAPAGGSRAATVAQFLNGQGIQVAASALTEVSSGSALNNITIVRFEERAGGMNVYGVYAKAAFNSQGDLVHLIENVVPATSVGPGGVNASQALAAALRRQYGDAVALPPQARAQGNSIVFAKTPFFHDEPSATRVALVTDEGLQQATLVETWSQKENLLHQTLVGRTGDVLAVELRTNSDKYNVFQKDPGKAAQTPVTGPASVSPAGTVPSPSGWLGTGAQNTVAITGNNAQAYLDADANNRADKGGSAVSNGEFMTAWNSSVAPTTTSNKAVAVQNLFYLNNVIHDALYTHGFNEGAGNFQTSNFGRGTGLANDAVLAEAQDGSGTDNANFSTPADGRSPRMQMYLWSNPGPDHEVVVGSAAYGAKKADFGPTMTLTGVTAGLVLANDGVSGAGTPAGTPNDGCESFSGVSGKVVLVERGFCSFKRKVANAQAAGAKAVVVINNVNGTEIFAMANDTAIRTTITIPAVMVGQFDGGTLKTLTGSSAIVRKKNVVLLQTDATLDSDVVFHEYGHGLTWRMIGNMSGPLAGAIGEGASDGVALLMNDDDKVGEYSAGAPTGIRRYPYAGYPLTYKAVTGAEVHDDGELFAAIVWRMKELTSGSGVTVSQLFDHYVNGMNYTAAGPAWENMRDGMLQSASGNPAVTCIIWTAYAQFGVGQGASGVVNKDGTVTITESFLKPANACN
jgi:extracellular elastinolytic metalloproteinase